LRIMQDGFAFQEVEHNLWGEIDPSIWQPVYNGNRLVPSINRHLGDAINGLLIAHGV
jgi:hypothetical protein